jgi:aspartyl protease family protein
MRTLTLSVIVGLALAVGSSSLSADEASAKAKLADQGLRVTHAGLSLTDEADLNKAFGEAAALKRKMAVAARDLGAIQEQDEEIHENVRELTQQNVAINRQLAASRNRYLHNQLVGAANANMSEMKLMMQGQQQSKKEVDRVRQSANAAREKYVEQILKTRELADAVLEKYSTLAENKEARAALDEWNAAAKTKFKLAPSRMLKMHLKRLQALERTVISDKIPLRREGESYYVSVVINGQPAQELIVDSGANTVMLPYKIAQECGVSVDASSPDVTIGTANGGRSKAKLAMADTIRIGKFTANNVQCIVLGPEATNAPALLGMSFLNRYKFELNAQGSTLSMMEVTAEPGPLPRAKTSHTAKTSKKTIRPAVADE